MKERKKFLIYVNSMNAFGGIERVISNLSNNLIKHVDITILVKDKSISSYNLDSKIKIDSLNNELKMNMDSKIKRVFSVFKNTIKSIKLLKKYFKTNNYDYIYTSIPTNGLEVYLSCKNNRNKIIAAEHASYYAYNKIYKIIKKWLYPKLKAISVPTTMDTEIYKKLGYNAYHIPHLSTFEKVEKNKVTNKVAINVGRLTNDKQQELLLKIWKNIDPKSKWILKIIGSGENEYKLKEYIKNNDIKNVEMIPHTSNIEKYYKKSSLFLFTSKMEGFGMVLLEAMSFGVPCISFDCPSGPRDVVKNNYNGYLIPCYNIEEYIDRINEYINSTIDRKKEMSLNANKTIKEWNNKKIIDDWLKIFKKIDELNGKKEC